MAIHLHHSRIIMGWILGIMAVSPFALCFESAETKIVLADVKGHVTYSGQPVNGSIICLDTEGGAHSAYGLVKPDGSFNLLNMNGAVAGANPGRYYAHLTQCGEGPAVPPKYRDPKQSGLAIDIAPDWSELSIDLH